MPGENGDYDYDSAYTICKEVFEPCMHITNIVIEPYVESN